MNQDQTTAPSTSRQQVIDALKKANNVLITVSQNPTRDQLASCIGLALMLNKLNKHATAIFSGTVPSTIDFLQPEKLLEVNTDSLRDFIISLDRNKADKLRYKVEDNVVRIFITPYRTALNEKDLIFSQGDFNVDAVIALGVDQREHLDLAIMQQGRILHDAVVIGVSAGVNPSNVGAINWHEPTASSISELVVGVGDALQGGLLDAQIATALLTGIVSETDRFRNERTTAKVMTISAQLMAAGANQQLVAKQLDVAPQAQTATIDATPSVDKLPEVSFDVPKEGENSTKEVAVSLHIDPDGPAPAVQLPGDVTDEDIKRIMIDEEGTLYDDVPQIDQIINKPHKVIQPLDDLSASAVSSGYITNPPERGGTLTAEAQDSSMAEEPNPSLQSPPITPLLDHAPALPSPVVSPDSIDAVESPKPETSVSTLPSESSLIMNPAPAPVIPLEPIVLETEAIDQETARKAVMEAVASSPTITPPTPIVALNAMPLDLGAHALPQPAQHPLAPPPLPPPIMPIDDIQVPAPMPNPEITIPAPQQGNTPFNLPPPQQ